MMFQAQQLGQAQLVRSVKQARACAEAPNFESYDAYSNSPEKLLLHFDEGDEVPVFEHYEPFVNLTELDQKSILRDVYEGIVEPAQAY